jgi:hypothetical protein
MVGKASLGVLGVMVRPPSSALFIFGDRVVDSSCLVVLYCTIL